ncbi:WG repeat-containing protein [Hymenobacter glacieicola]|uniref:NERD domain-containing protein n=1 Tax=Hymenobacter glacieicola TaxID=1562124 RepID=A0ABQ1WP49_9BACT|nr:WG repeat-containing protein [Hymenobacter glacieicola]GGG37549.1 hypothetical protein GCM10011378_12330 [Hymenobacter glacieicola]
MLHHFLFAPFSNVIRQRQYEQLLADLQADTTAPVSLLLGNFAVGEHDTVIDALVVRPHSITLVLFVPQGGKLAIPAFEYGGWQLNGQPLGGTGKEADNPFEQYRQQKAAVVEWLAPQFGPEQMNLQVVTGVVLFAAPVSFAEGVEQQVRKHPDAGFHLLADASQFPRQLKQLARPEIDLSAEELSNWARELAQDVAEPASPVEPAPVPISAPASSKGVLGRLWGWLGAEDIPEDTPYGHPAGQVAEGQAEKQRLEQLRLEAQQELRQKLQALEAREAQREHNMAQLQAQLAQAAPVPSQAQAIRDQLAAESSEKAALEAAIKASRAESEARNRDLDAKIERLGGLLDQLQARTVTAAPVGSAPAAASGSSATAGPRSAGYRRLRTWRRRLPRLAAVAGVAGLLGLGVWGASHLGRGAAAPAPYQENGKWGFADPSGKQVVPAKYSSVSSFQQERAVVEENGVYGIVDAEGKEVVPLAYDALNPYAEGYARVRVGDAYTFVDEQGQEFDTYYFNALDFSEGVAAVLDHRGWYYITGPQEPNKEPALFQEAYSFRDGLARVRLADGYTYITKDYLSDSSQGTTPFGRYESATDFENGKAQVTQSGRSFTIDTNGEPVE